jgi:TolB protein
MRISGKWVLLAGLVASLALFLLGMIVVAQSPILVKTASPAALPPGGAVHYTGVFSNSTGSAMQLDVITDTLPADFVFTTVLSGNEVGYPDLDTNPLVWNGPYTVPVSGSLTVKYAVYVGPDVPPGIHENELVGRMAAGQIVSSTAPVTVLGAVLSGTKSADVEEVMVGDPVVYEVMLENHGTASATIDSLVDTLPTAFTFQEVISQPVELPQPDLTGNQLTWTGPFFLEPGESFYFAYRLTAGGDPGERSNTFVVTYDGGQSETYRATVEVALRLYELYLPLVFRTPPPTPPPTPEPSRRLAYHSKATGSFEIYARDADGGDVINISNETGGDLNPDWAPDGDRVAWVHFAGSSGEIYAANADGTGKANLTNHPKDDRGPDWSPDGTKIAFYSYREEDRWEVYTMDADGSNVQRLTYHACQSHDPLWSPDGSRIAYVCGLDPWSEVYVMNPDGSDPVRLTNNERDDGALAWSPDGLFIAYVRDEVGDTEIWKVSLVNGVNTQVLDNNVDDFSPAWSPDGTKIAFSTFLDGSYEIALMDPDGTNLENLTRTALGDFLPRWSPDGTQIGFISTRNNDRGLYVMDADGGNQMRLDFVAPLSDKAEDVHDWRP